MFDSLLHVVLVFVCVRAVRARVHCLRVCAYAYLLRHMFHQKCVLHTMACGFVSKILLLATDFYVSHSFESNPISIPCISFTSDCSLSHCRCLLIFHFTVKMIFKYLLLSALTHHADVPIHTSMLRFKAMEII